MTATAEQLRSDLLALPETDRLELAYVLLESVEQPLAEEELDDETERIIAQRRAEALAGSVELIPSEEALRRVREDLASQFKQEA